MASTITITNNNENPVVINATVDTATISPSPVTTPTTPYTLYEGDMAYRTDGHVTVPVYNKFQNVVVPAGKKFTIESDNAVEIAYYQNLVIEGCDIVVDPEVIEEA